jgi:hypothetical protein
MIQMHHKSPPNAINDKYEWSQNKKTLNQIELTPFPAM